ncbi:MAG: D-amino-acid transaminase [Rhizobiaceae bacterium]|nr:D-amino-acid transaminase [Rhizobiaceae bacterium]
MSRIAYVNGRYVPHSSAAVHIEDRGYQFADGVYEVCEVKGGFIIDMRGHLNRLDRSLGELSIQWPLHRSALERILAEVVRRNRIRNGLVYLQVTRGVARRDHVFPGPNVRPALVITATRSDPKASDQMAATGIDVITVPENRWERVDIKTVGLLPNVLARQQAKDAGAQEAWFVDKDGIVLEGSATNAWIVTQDGAIVTRDAERGILRGITRTTLFEVAKKLGLKVVERGFTVDEALMAREAFVTSATKTAISVISINGSSIGNGHPGSVASALRGSFFDVAEKTPA